MMNILNFLKNLIHFYLKISKLNIIILKLINELKKTLIKKNSLNVRKLSIC